MLHLPESKKPTRLSTPFDPLWASEMTSLKSVIFWTRHRKNSVKILSVILCNHLFLSLVVYVGNLRRWLFYGNSSSSSKLNECCFFSDYSECQPFCGYTFFAPTNAAYESVLVADASDPFEDSKFRKEFILSLFHLEERLNRNSIDEMVALKMANSKLITVGKNDGKLAFLIW